jgi:hypothetical protein
MRPLLAALSCAFASVAAAQDVKLPPEPKVQRIVVEDEAVRIEELRVRGQTQRIVVQPKKGALTRPYEVLPLQGGRDPSQTRNGQPGAAGKRVWQVLSF